MHPIARVIAVEVVETFRLGLRDLTVQKHLHDRDQVFNLSGVLAEVVIEAHDREGWTLLLGHSASIGEVADSGLAI